MKRRCLLSTLFFLTILSATQAAPEKKSISFSSAYTNLQTECGSGMTAREEKAVAEQGQDIPAVCKGFGGYEIFVASDGANTQFQVRKKTARREKDVVMSENMDISDDIYSRKVEWRLANGKPFAVIFRVGVFQGDDPTSRKKIGEQLRIVGLSDEKINFEVNIKGTPNPNEQARKLADQAFFK